MTWIATIGGSVFDFLAPKPESINIQDIAHALSQINRYTGHCVWPYSVAQHSVLLARQLPPEYRLEGLLHDAHEAYTGDISAPLKALLGQEIKKHEDAAQRAVWEAIASEYNLVLRHEEAANMIHDIDVRMRHTEKRLLADCGRRWNIPGAPLENLVIEPMVWQIAKGNFLSDFRSYVNQRWKEQESSPVGWGGKMLRSLASGSLQEGGDK